MTAIRAAAEAVPLGARDDFLRQVAAELETRPRDVIGPGLVGRVVRELALQREFRPDVAVGEPRHAASETLHSIPAPAGVRRPKPSSASDCRSGLYARRVS